MILDLLSILTYFGLSLHPSEHRHEKFNFWSLGQIELKVYQDKVGLPIEEDLCC